MSNSLADVRCFAGALCLQLAAAVPPGSPPASTTVAQESPGLTDTAIEDRLCSLRAASEHCEWARVEHEADALLAAMARGTDAWIEAGARRGVAAWKLGEHERLERIARDVQVAVLERRNADPRNPNALPRSLDLHVAIPALGLEPYRAFLSQ